jgi:signal peptidase I
MDRRRLVNLERRAARRSSTGWGFVRDALVVVLIAVLASFLIKTFLIRSFYIPSASMENTLLGEPGHHDRILVDELVPRLVPLQRGDVVVFTDPGGWLQGDQPAASGPSSALSTAADWVLSLAGVSARDANDHLVKRLIGLPGDHITCCNALGQLSVNGSPLKEPYARVPAGARAVSREPFDVTVQPGDVWVMGDNRYESADSVYHQDTATHGGVPIRNIVGRAFVISWPLTRWSYLSNYPDTFDGVASAHLPG